MSKFVRLGEIDLINIFITKNIEKICQIAATMKDCLLRNEDGHYSELIFKIGLLLNECGDETKITPEMICKNCSHEDRKCSKKK